MIVKERMNRIMAAWKIGCFEKMDDHLVHTIPNHYLIKMDVLPKTFFQIILAAKWLVRHSTTAATFAFSSVFILLLWFRKISCEMYNECADDRLSKNGKGGEKRQSCTV